MAKTTKISSEIKENLLKTLEKRFLENKARHENVDWQTVLKNLQKSEEKIASLLKMEESGGEPDVITFDEQSDELVFVDCASESPKGRRSFCYDRAAWEKRKEHKPENTAFDFAEELGIEILDETQYRKLQEMGKFDLKTSSWIKTPENIRKLGGALFCDRRYDTVFTYHNGAESYYAARGFRGMLKL